MGGGVAAALDGWLACRVMDIVGGVGVGWRVRLMRKRRRGWGELPLFGIM